MLLLARRGVRDAEELRRERRAEMVKDGKVVVTCEFCSSVYQFTPHEAAWKSRRVSRTS
jgi:redox-regulated HSP33 family molecular chaperone